MQFQTVRKLFGGEGEPILPTFIAFLKLEGEGESKYCTCNPTDRSNRLLRSSL